MRQVRNDEDLNEEITKVGECDGLLNPETKGMLTITTLPLAGGEERGDHLTGPEADEGSAFTETTNPEDEALGLEQNDVFVFYLKLKLVSIHNMLLKLYLSYHCILKSILHAYRGRNSDSERFIFSKSWRLLSSS